MRGDLKSQELFYKQFYGYGMAICLRYLPNKEEAKEVLNDSFLKIFAQIQQLQEQDQFKSWIRRIIVNTALDRLRKNKKFQMNTDIEDAQLEIVDSNVLNKLSAEEIMGMLQKLPDNYRTVFNLYEIEGFNHEEIAKMLGIPVGTSKSNLSRAKAKLKAMILATETQYL
ncbi:MAG: RNA polymerase sigma factor [Bacteroidetes bacterium]|nr:MAG: RNA polymerase sigma factor [Bacteroidota bacterium]